MIQSLLVSFLFISSSPFYHLITFLLTLVLIFHRDFTNPNLPTEQKGRPSQVRSVWFFIYLFMNQIFLLIFMKCILIYIYIFLFHLLWNSLDMVMQETCMQFRVLDPGQVLNILNFFGCFVLFCFVFRIVLFFSVLMFVLFSLFPVGFPQVGTFHVNLKSQFDIILAQLNILRSYYHFVSYEK